MCTNPSQKWWMKKWSISQHWKILSSVDSTFQLLCTMFKEEPNKTCNIPGDPGRQSLLTNLKCYNISMFGYELKFVCKSLNSTFSLRFHGGHQIQISIISRILKRCGLKMPRDSSGFLSWKSRSVRSVMNLTNGIPVLLLKECPLILSGIIFSVKNNCFCSCLGPDCISLFSCWQMKKLIVKSRELE